MKIRPFELNDLEIVQQLDTEIFQSLFNQLQGESVKIQPREPEYFIFWHQTDPKGSLVVELEKEVVGFVFSHARGESGWIGPLGVKPQHQGRGLGKTLTEEGIKYLKEAGCKFIGLATYPNNLVSLSLYLKLGFEVAGGLIMLKREVKGWQQQEPEKKEFKIELVELADLPQIAQNYRDISGFDRLADLEFFLRWKPNSGFKIVKKNQIEGYAFCTLRRRQGQIAIFGLSERLAIDLAARLLLDKCFDFFAQESLSEVTLWVTADKLKMLQFLFQHGFRTAISMVNMHLQAPGKKEKFWTTASPEKG